jgi:RNA polymerase sigma-70 factor (ECF subfamily)
MNKTRSQNNRSIAQPEVWVDQYGDYLYSYALPRVQDASVAEDLVQETFLAALKARTSYEGRSSARTWLMGILKHKIVDYFRKNWREQPEETPELNIADADSDFDAKGNWRLKPARWKANPLKLYQQKVFFEVLNRCLSDLPSKLAHVFVLREMDGLDTEEICKVLKISPTNCWVMLHRVRHALRKCLEINWFEKKPGSTKNEVLDV